MFSDQRLSVPDRPEALREEYLRTFGSIVDSVGVDRAAAETPLDRATLEALVDGESPSLSLEAASELQALEANAPDPETIRIEACEHLLLGMSTAVLDVETLAAAVELDLDPKEIQQKLERRAAMSFDEFVHLQHAIGDRAP
ncbi:DUF5791 family protein [Halovivax limisalsi]|uniref:DUF5791 family protein n=1 Tax=Halovivax limisalsi TaxID=1453760 RepID=UPI001FFD76BD|nr:DUF5791 family protein [Halovivax limisalsi]